MKTDNKKEVKIYLKNIDKFDGESLWHLILQKVKDSSLSGATIYKAVAGVGQTKQIHTFDILNLSQDVPLVIEMVDDSDKIDEFLKANKELLRKTFITLKPIEIVTFI